MKPKKEAVVAEAVVAEANVPATQETVVAEAVPANVRRFTAKAGVCMTDPDRNLRFEQRFIHEIGDVVKDSWLYYQIEAGLIIEVK